MIIKNVKIYTEDMVFKNGDIHIQNGVFATKTNERGTIDGKGCYAIPGLIDLHFHGCAGYDFCDGTPEALAKIAEHEAASGITGIAPATMTLPSDELEQILRTASAFRKSQTSRVQKAENQQAGQIAKSQQASQIVENQSASQIAENQQASQIAENQQAKQIAENQQASQIAEAPVTNQITESQQTSQLAENQQASQLAGCQQAGQVAGCRHAGHKIRADLIGINMEGPFISKAKRGAQDPKHIIPCSVEMGRKFIEASEGLVKFIGIAPEENPDFAEFITQMKDHAHISLAHTNTDYATAMAAFSAGADHAVHLYNAMPPFTHREPGVIGAVADSPHVYAELICDGIHVHPCMVRATFRMLGPDRIVFISDSMRATGMPDERYTLGGLDVDVTGRRATLASNSALAGSVSDLMECMRTAVTQMGIPLETAVACACVNPAKCLGVYDTRGSIGIGKKADLVLLDETLKIRMVIKDGVHFFPKD